MQLIHWINLKNIWYMFNFYSILIFRSLLHTVNYASKALNVLTINAFLTKLFIETIPSSTDLHNTFFTEYCKSVLSNKLHYPGQEAAKLRPHRWKNVLFLVRKLIYMKCKNINNKYDRYVHHGTKHSPIDIVWWYLC